MTMWQVRPFKRRVDKEDQTECQEEGWDGASFFLGGGLGVGGGVKNAKTTNLIAVYLTNMFPETKTRKPV